MRILKVLTFCIVGIFVVLLAGCSGAALAPATLTPSLDVTSIAMEEKPEEEEQPAANLLKNPDASLGLDNWSVYGEAFIDNSTSSDFYFAVRNGGQLSQEVAIEPEAIGQYVLLIALVSSERINANGSITGLPVLYGYMMGNDNHINTYLQDESMLCNATRADEWVAAWGIFEIPPSTSRIVFFLNQALGADGAHNGSAARFDDVGLYIVKDEASAKQLIAQFKEEFLP